MIRDLVLKNRTYRRFFQDKKIEKSTLMELIDLARLSSSGGNLQSLKYIISVSDEKNEKIFSCLKWAGYLRDWDGPSEGEKPVAYIVMLHDKSISQNYFWDHGIAVQSIMLGAVEKGLGGCMFGSIDREALRSGLDIEERFDILMVVALGVPREHVVLEDIGPSGDLKYWRDESQVHHVPKRKLEDLILE